eukprot:scaffold1270_cov56-Phaeocystis_antarctica.AAC.1
MRVNRGIPRRVPCYDYPRSDRFLPATSCVATQKNSLEIRFLLGGERRLDLRRPRAPGRPRAAPPTPTLSRCERPQPPRATVRRVLRSPP